jgi:hypothetical protein
LKEPDVTEEVDKFHLPHLDNQPKTGEVTITVDWDRVSLLMLHATKGLVLAKEFGAKEPQLLEKVSLGKDAINELTKYLLERADEALHPEEKESGQDPQETAEG